MSGFYVSHGSVTDEKALAAATNVEHHLGRLLNGDKKAIKTMNIEDLVVLIQFARNKASAATSEHAGEKP